MPPPARIHSCCPGVFYVVLLRQSTAGLQSLFESNSAIEQMMARMLATTGRRPSEGDRDYLLDFLPGLDNRQEAVVGVAYLHNATQSGVSDLRGTRDSSAVRMFTGERKADFLDFLRTRLDPEIPGATAADQLLGMKAGPSRQLLTVAAREIREREQFILLDEQRLAFDIVVHEVERARAADSKTVVIISGGPGSGKSVIALSLLGELARQGRTVLHATGSRSFTQTLRMVAGKGSKRVKSMFKYFNSFMEAERNGLDVLILDEAHRIRETSVNRYTRAEFRNGRPQIDELMAAARVPVFLLDEYQVVRPGELATVAAQVGVPVPDDCTDEGVGEPAK